MATIEESASEEKLKEWVAKKMTYPSVLAVVDIIEKHPDHFSSFEDFVKHALEMNLVWWSPNPQDIMKLMARNLITEEQNNLRVNSNLVIFKVKLIHIQEFLRPRGLWNF